MTVPAYNSDRPAELDTLGRTQFARHLAKALLSVSASDGLVVGIEGGWGTGKSTVIGFVKTELAACSDAATKAIVVDFNPWMVSNTGALIDALVTQIAAAINLDPGGTPGKAIKAGERLLGYIGLIRHLKYLKYVPGTAFAGNIAEDLAEIADNAADATKEAGDALSDVKRLLPTLDLAKKKAEVAEALRDFNRPIVVIVDDVDRLPADEIRTLVQAIKAVADFPRTTYLIAYDRDVVAAALGNGNAAPGQSYLEKIVQVAYPIPPLFEYQLRSFVDKQLQTLFSTLNIELRDFEASGYPKAVGLLTRLARHPRDVVRLMNRLMLSLPATRNEVNVTDVLVFEAISQRFPQIRESVHCHPTDFTGHAFRGDSGVEDDDFDWTRWAKLEADQESDQPAWAKYLPKQEPDLTIASKACAFLFPDDFRKHDRVPEDELHIADPDRLARYFRMMSLESVPEASDIHKKLQRPELLAEAIANIEPPELTFLLEWIHNYLPSCAAPDAMGCSVVLVDCATLAQSSLGLTRDLAELFAKVLARLVRKGGLDTQNDIFKLIIAKAPLSISESVLLEAAAEQGKWIVRPDLIKATEAQLVGDGRVVDEALASWSDRVRNSISSDALAKEPRMHAILYRFAQLNFAYEEVYAAVNKICSTDEGLQRFLSRHVKNSPFEAPDEYGLVEDAQALADRINSSSIRDDYLWLMSHLTSPELSNTIRAQSLRLRALRRISD
ncbi:P-loop NTPase fold protein [Cupriavidus sp. UYPR2.512]|uniref:KAP family P-loop NTPase fold protein n=1 Tax=Cupriavidus sp. UYPR2.512 TaxID=1080187 RepID=UPI0003A3B882|nr:P-loop NTPase fold protein [Cupriavidus sp. UYPR2.512]